jgi:UDP-GlcNAc:undecaprenyl-phosphate GlcNAc-1-phosphate transferase
MHFEVLLISLTAIVLGLCLYPVFIRLYAKNNILDKREGRKIHLNEVPTMGGVPIFIAFLVTIFIWLPFNDLAANRYLIGSLIFILFIGLRDDFVDLKPMAKLISQTAPALVMFYLGDIAITSFYGFISANTFPVTISLVVTLATIVVITNSFNLIDGLDGLAGSISIIVFLALGIWFSLVGEQTFAVLLFAISGSIIAFLRYNWQPAKIFMGDTGALIIGFLASISIIKFINLNSALESSNPFKFEGILATAFAILIIPLFDTLRIFTLRIIKKKSPFSADKNHLHHSLLRFGLSHSRVTIFLVGINLIFITSAIILRDVSDEILIPSLLIVGLLLSLVMDYLFIKYVLIKGKNESKSVMEIIKSSRKAS